MDEQTHETEAGAVIAITREAGAGALRKLDPEDGLYYSVVVPEGYHRETIDLTPHLPNPVRAAGTVKLQTVDDFMRYVDRHDDSNRTTVWVDMDNAAIVAVLDDHATVSGESVAAGQRPGWGQHRGALKLKHTPEWMHWLKLDGQLIDQERFAEHVEDGQIDVVEPDAATLLEIVSTMQGATNATWKNAVRLQDGAVQFVYTEEASATAGNGEIEIPATFKLGLAPFLGEEPVELTARLRYRVSGGNLRIGYKLDRPADVVRFVLDAIADRLHAKFTGDRVFVGQPRDGATELPF